jgi:hypothetical protein
MDEDQSQIVNAAEQILRGEIDPVLGCRAIVARLRSCDPAIASLPLFLAIKGFESETDHFPLGDARTRWDLDELSKLDQERVAYTADCEQTLRVACQEIVAFFRSE